MLISTAYAQGTGLFDQNALIQFLPLILIFVVFYFLLIRPNQTRQKKWQEMLNQLKPAHMRHTNINNDASFFIDMLVLF